MYPKISLHLIPILPTSNSYFLCQNLTYYADSISNHGQSSRTYTYQLYPQSTMNSPFVTKRLGEILTPAIFALISIFGNVHRPCKYYSNIVKNSLHHVYSFFFLSFLAIFVENYQIWKCAQTDHVNSSPTTSPIVSTILISFSDVIAWK